MGHYGAMLDFPRLAAAIQARARELGYDQEELIALSGASRSTVQRLWAATAQHRPRGTTTARLESTLRWATGSIDSTLDGGDPTPLSQTTPSPTPERGSVAADTTLPIPVRIAAEFGRLLDYDVYVTDVDGEQVKVVSLAYTSSEALEALSKQLERFDEIKGYVRQKAETGGGDGSAETSDDGPADE